MNAVVTTDIAVAPRRAASLSQLARRLNWALVGVAVLLALGSIFLVITSLSAPTYEPSYVRGFGAVLAIGYALIGSRIATRQPHNAVGWLILATGIAFGLIGLAEEYLSVTGPRTLLPETLVRAIIVVAFLPTLFGSLFLLLFPDGRLGSLPWYALAAFAVVTNGIAIVLAIAAPVPPASGDLDSLTAASRALAAIPLFALANAAATLALALAGGSLLVRLARAQGDERQQLKGVAAAGAFAVVANVVDSLVPTVPLLGYLNLAGILAFPLAAGIAMQRYRLYDIDTIISRTLVYVVVTAFLAGLTAALLGSTQRLFIALTGQSSEVAIVITTLVLVAIFTPLRDFVQRSIDARLKAPARGLKGLRSFADEVREFAHFSDRERLVMRLLSESVAALDATGGAAEVRDGGGAWSVRPTGDWRDDAHVTATIADDKGAAARVRLGPRRNAEPYSEKQLTEFRDAVAAVAEAL